jgi:transcriptional regulator with XRE-family HTH domain
MRLSSEKLKILCRARGLSQKDLLDQSGVSKTAYFHLLAKRSVLPRSIQALADTIGVQASSFLVEETEEERVRNIAHLTEAIVAHRPNLDRDDVRHTLLLLEEEPIERLRRALIRGRKNNLR